MYKAKIHIIRRRSILDPQGKAVEKGIKLMGFENVSDVRIDKYVEFLVETDNYDEAYEATRKISNDLLANPNIEDFKFELEKI